MTEYKTSQCAVIASECEAIQLINKQDGTYGVTSEIDRWGIINTDLGDYNKDNVDQLAFMVKLNKENRQKDERKAKNIGYAIIAGIVTFLTLIGLNTALSHKNSKPAQEEVTKTINVVKDTIAKDLPKDTLKLF